MKRTILAVSVCLGVSPAYATDWALNSTLSETVELNNNPYLRAIAAGTFSSYSSIVANAVARTPTSKFVFDGDIGYRKIWGPGVDGVQSESLNGGAKAHYETYGKNRFDRNYVDASWHRQSTAFALLGDLGFVTTSRGFIDRTSLVGGIERAITNLDSISLSARSTYTSYDPSGGGTAFSDTTASGTWRHRVNPIAAFTASSDVEVLDFNNTQNSMLTVVRETAGVDATFSPTLSFRGNAGVVFAQTERGSSAISLAQSSNSSVSKSAADVIANVVLTYKMFPDTIFTFNGGQSVSPSIVGSLTKRTNAGIGLTRLVNSRTTLSFSADASRQVSSGTTSEFLSASMVYGYLLTREWTAQLSYRYLHRFATSGTTSGLVVDPVTGVPVPVSSGLGAANSNSIMLVVSRRVDILPNGY